MGSKSSRLFVAPITSKLKGQRKFPEEKKNEEKRFFLFLKNGSHTESGEKKEVDCEEKKGKRFWYVTKLLRVETKNEVIFERHQHTKSHMVQRIAWLSLFPH